MNEKIMNWSSAALYNSKIFAHDDVKARLLTDFKHVRLTDETGAPLALIDTLGCDLDECKGTLLPVDLKRFRFFCNFLFNGSCSLADEDGSVSNEGEALVVMKYLEELLASGVHESQIAVITPYYAQVKLLREKAQLAQRKDVKINTVDGFQVFFNSLNQVFFIIRDARRKL
jgi:DNA polymerase alpha-associated DNA helicase A